MYTWLAISSHIQFRNTTKKQMQNLWWQSFTDIVRMPSTSDSFTVSTCWLVSCRNLISFTATNLGANQVWLPTWAPQEHFDFRHWHLTSSVMASGENLLELEHNRFCQGSILTVQARDCQEHQLCRLTIQ